MWIRRESTCRPQRISQSAYHVIHCAPAFGVFVGEAANLFFAASVIVPKLDATAIHERHKEAVDSRRPIKAPFGESKLLDHEWMQQTCKVGAGRHPNIREWFFDCAGTTD